MTKRIGEIVILPTSQTRPTDLFDELIFTNPAFTCLYSPHIFEKLHFTLAKCRLKHSISLETCTVCVWRNVIKISYSCRYGKSSARILGKWMLQKVHKHSFKSHCNKKEKGSWIRRKAKFKIFRFKLLVQLNCPWQIDTPENWHS